MPSLRSEVCHFLFTSSQPKLIALGPKTDVLEALLRRVDGLEAKLKEKNHEQPSALGEAVEMNAALPSISPTDLTEHPEKQPVVELDTSSQEVEVANHFSPVTIPKFVI